MPVRIPPIADIPIPPIAPFRDSNARSALMSHLANAWCDLADFSIAFSRSASFRVRKSTLASIDSICGTILRVKYP